VKRFVRWVSPAGLHPRAHLPDTTEVLGSPKGGHEGMPSHTGEDTLLQLLHGLLRDQMIFDFR